MIVGGRGVTKETNRRKKQGAEGRGMDRLGFGVGNGVRKQGTRSRIRRGGVGLGKIGGRRVEEKLEAWVREGSAMERRETYGRWGGYE